MPTLTPTQSPLDDTFALYDQQSCGGLQGRWLGAQSISECYFSVLADSGCSDEFFRHATDGDQNCWCFTAGSLDSCNWEGPTQWGIWTYYQVPGTHEPTIVPVEQTTLAGTTGSPIEDPTLEPSDATTSAEPTLYYSPYWQLYREESCDDVATAWMGVYSTDVSVCMNAVLARSDCSHTVFKHASGEGGDLNCGCVPTGTVVTDCTFLGPNTWGIWTYVINTGTAEPTITYYDDCTGHTSDDDTIACLKDRVDTLDAEVDSLTNQVNSVSGECDSTLNDLSDILASCT